MPHTVWLEHTLLPALAMPLSVSASSGSVAAVLLAADAVGGVTAAAAWVSVALSAISMFGVLARVIANDRQATREFDQKMRSLIAENAALHAKDAAQQEQINRLKAVTRANTQNIEAITRTSDSGFHPAPDLSAVVPSPVPPPEPEPPPQTRPRKDPG